MKHIVFILFLFIGIISCNTKENDSPAPDILKVSEEETLKNEVTKYPDSLLVLDKLLAYYTDKENYGSALAALNKAIAKDSINPELRSMQSFVFAVKGDTAEAIHSLQEAIKIYPMPVYIISLGALYAEIKDPLALAMADALLAAPESRAEKEAYFIKGLYYSFTNKKEKAIPFFDKSLSADYRFMDAYLEKGLALYDLKKYNDAAGVFLKAVTLQNNFDRGYYYLGQSYEKLNRKDDAREAYEKAILYDPNYEEAKNALEKLGGKTGN